MDGVLVAPDGTVYVSDAKSHIVVKVDAAGTITTFAGNGTKGKNGDGHPASKAQLDSPSGLAMDGQGNVYIADQVGVVRKVGPDGVISTFVPSGTLERPAGLAVDATTGDVYVADLGANRVYKAGPQGGAVSLYAGNGDPGPPLNGAQATQSTLPHPSDIATDGQGNLYLSSSSSDAPVASVVLKSDQTIHLLELPGFRRTDCGLAVDGSGNVFVGDTGGEGDNVDPNLAGVWMFAPKDGKPVSHPPQWTPYWITAIGEGALGDGGPASEGHVTFPGMLSVTSGGDLGIGDSVARRVRLIPSAPTAKACALEIDFLAPPTATLRVEYKTGVWTDISGGKGWYWPLDQSGTYPVSIVGGGAGYIALTVTAGRVDIDAANTRLPQRVTVSRIPSDINRFAFSFES
ncbi:hypothetical protein BU198_09520 [Streptomyces sp. CBMA156]|nr:hypothetical protein [Streptomyces sp. CBMA156]